jgi:hypothetical protein
MSEMIERVARRIALTRCRAEGRSMLDVRGMVMDWEAQVDVTWRQHVGEAAEILRELREPTESMKVAAVDGAGRMPPLSKDMDFSEVWIAMIDAALKEPT